MGNMLTPGWRQVLSSFLLLGIVGMITSTYSVLAIPLSNEFAPSRMVLMLAITVLAVVSGILAPFVGSLMDRVSLRQLMMLGSVLLCAGYTALSWATSFTQVLIIFGLFMAPANVLFGPMAVTVLLSRWFVKRRGTAMGIAIAGISMGGIVYSPLIQWLLDNYEWRTAMRLLAAGVLALTFAATAMVVNFPKDRGLFPDGGTSDPEAVAKGENAVITSTKAILANPTFWWISLLFAIVLSGMKGAIANIVPLAIDQGISATDAAFLISIFSACGLVSKFFFAALADKMGPKIFTMVAFAGFSAGMACLAQATSGYGMIAFGMGMIGMFGGLVVPLQSLIVPQVFGRGSVGKAMGLMSTVSLAASFATPPVFGLMHDLTGSYSGISILFAVLAGAALFIVPYIRFNLPVSGKRTESLQTS